MSEGGHSGLNTYPPPMAAWSGSGDLQNLGVVNSIWGKKGGSQLQTQNIMGELAYNLCMYSLYCII